MNTPRVEANAAWGVVPWLGALGIVWWTVVSWVGVTRAHVHRGAVELFANEPGMPWSWWGWLHPPLAATWVDALDLTERVLGWTHGLSVLATAGAFDVAVLLLGAAWVTRRQGPVQGAITTVLLALTASWLRPFEHYPLAMVLVTSAVILMERWFSTGRWTYAIAAWIVGMAAASTHLFAGVILVGAAVTVGAGNRARWPGVLWMLTGWTAVGLWMAWPEAFRLLERGPGPRGSVGSVSLEWTNPALLLGAVWAWWRGGSARVLASAALGCVGVVILTQAAQVADGQPWPWSLHYLSLVDPLLVLACAAAAGRREIGVLLLTQALWWARGVAVAWPDLEPLGVLLAPWRWGG